MQRTVFRQSGEILAVALVYYVTARLGLLLAIPPGYATPIWPPAGVALTAVLLRGLRMSPGVWLGSFLANVFISFDPSSSDLLASSLLLPVGIGAGAALQAIAGAALIRRFVGFPTPLNNDTDIVRFLFLGGPISCLISASIGVSSLFLTRTMPAVSYVFSWWNWWVGDTIGVLVVAPLVLAWLGKPRDIWRRRRVTVTVPLCLMFSAVVGIFFGVRRENYANEHGFITWVMLASGLALTGLVGAFQLVVSGHAMLFEQLSIERSAELERKHQTEEALRREQSQLQAILNHAPVLISVKDLQGKMLLANRSLFEIADIPPSEKFIGRPVFDLFPQDIAEKLWANDPATLQNNGLIRAEETVRHKDGTWHTYLTMNFPVRYLDTEEPFGICAISTDITENKHTEHRIREAALHDSLTGLPNRALVFEYANHLLAAAQRSHGHGALLYIDLDRFKPINDLYGHEVGDRLLQDVAQRLLACTRQEDLVARIGGDEFVIILPYLGHDNHAAAVAEHVLDHIGKPVLVNSLELSVSPSIGICHFPKDGVDIDTLLHNADIAMYQAKHSGRANFQYFTPEMNQQAEESLALEIRLKEALAHNRLALYYQPVIDIKSGHSVAVEALVRLNGTAAPAVGPDRFIPVAEATGLIGQLGEWVVANACRQHEKWLRQGLPPITIAVNVSPLQFRQRAFAEHLTQIVSRSGIDPHCVQLEVTESALMDNIDDAIETLHRIKALGVKVALDDFGTGYSSLSHLSTLPLDKLKVDQSFVRRLDNDPASRAITEAIIALGRTLKLEVVGEGVESENTLRYLREHGCDQAQGFLFSRPLPADEFAIWYRADSKRENIAV